MREEYDQSGMQTTYQPSLEELFEQARAKDEEQLRKRREELKKTSSNNSLHQVIRYIMYFWVGRMSLTLIGSLIPMIIALWRPDSLNSSHRSSLSLAKTEVIELPWKILLQQDFQSLKDSSLRKYPYLIKDVPTINNTTLRLFLSNLFKNHKMPIKTSTSPEFTYYSDDRLWSADIAEHHSQGLGYEYISLEDYFNRTKYQFPPFAFLDFMKPATAAITSTASGTVSTGSTPVAASSPTTDESNSAQSRSVANHFMYIGYPHMRPYLDVFAPSLAKLSSKLYFREPQCNLWIASSSVIAKLHFDYQDNFLLQLTGTKQVLLISPDAYPWVLPYSSLHPLWRQTSQSTHQIYDYLLQSSQTSPASATPKNYLFWNITLHPGEIVYIPSGFYHQVIAEEDSIGINAWFPSPFSEFQVKLSKLALPFLLDDTNEMKIAKLAIIMKEICIYLQDEIDCIVRYMTVRYQPVMNQLSINEKKCDISDELIYFCKPAEHLKIADTFHLNRRIARDIVGLLDTLDPNYSGDLGLSDVPKELKLLLIMDYIEEVLQLIFESNSSSKSSPKLSICMMEVLLSYCWNYDYLKMDL